MSGLADKLSVEALADKIRTIKSWGGGTMSYEEAVERASRDDAFKATVYAMNTLLIHKGIYTAKEYRQLFVEWVEKEERRKERQSATRPDAHPGIPA